MAGKLRDVLDKEAHVRSLEIDTTRINNTQKKFGNSFTLELHVWQQEKASTTSDDTIVEKQIYCRWHAIMRNNKRNIENKDRRRNGDDQKQQREKTFDKKKYRLKKYSNKYKINQWEERRKKAVLREFHKELKRNQQNCPQTLTDSNDTLKNAEEASNMKKKGYAFFKAKQTYQHIKEDKKKRTEEAIRIKEERKEALKKYKDKKMRAFKVLSKKTKKGQPVMKGRIEMLLEKIQENLT